MPAGSEGSSHLVARSISLVGFVSFTCCAAACSLLTDFSSLTGPSDASADALVDASVDASLDANDEPIVSDAAASCIDDAPFVAVRELTELHQSNGRADAYPFADAAK